MPRLLLLLLACLGRRGPTAAATHDDTLHAAHTAAAASRPPPLPVRVRGAAEIARLAQPPPGYCACYGREKAYSAAWLAPAALVANVSWAYAKVLEYHSFHLWSTAVHLRGGGFKLDEERWRAFHVNHVGGFMRIVLMHEPKAEHVERARVLGRTARASGCSNFTARATPLLRTAAVVPYYGGPLDKRTSGNAKLATDADILLDLLLGDLCSVGLLFGRVTVGVCSAADADAVRAAVAGLEPHEAGLDVTVVIFGCAARPVHLPYVTAVLRCCCYRYHTVVLPPGRLQLISLSSGTICCSTRSSSCFPARGPT